jgi:hypothetical protein
MPVETLSQISVPEVTPVADSLADANTKEARKEGWKRTQDVLLDWLRDGIPQIDQELKAPTKEAITEGLKISWSMSDSLAVPPSRVVPNGEGGLVFELFVYFEDQCIFQKMEIFENLDMQMSTFRNSRLEASERFPRISMPV